MIQNIPYPLVMAGRQLPFKPLVCGFVSNRSIVPMNINQESITVRAVLSELPFQEELYLFKRPVGSFAFLASGIMPDEAGSQSGIN